MFRTFRRLNWANAPVVAEVDVAHVETGAFTSQAPRPQCAEPPLVRQLRQRDFVWSMNWLKLAAAEELARRRHHRADVDQPQRRHLFRIAVDMRSRTTRSMRRSDAQLVLNPASPSSAAVAQMVDVIRSSGAVVDVDDALDHRNQVFLGQRARLQRRIKRQAPIQLIAAAQVIAPGRKTGSAQNSWRCPIGGSPGRSFL